MILMFSFNIAHASAGYTYTSESDAFRGCEREAAEATRSGYISATCMVELNSSTYVVRAYFCSRYRNPCQDNRSSNAHFYVARKNIGNFQYRAQAESVCESYVNNNECYLQNIADSYLGKSKKYSFSSCESSDNKMYPEYKKSGEIPRRGLCYAKFSLYSEPSPPSVPSNVNVSGFTRYSGKPALYNSYQKNIVLFNNNLDKGTFSGWIDWGSFPNNTDKIQLQVKIDFGPGMNVDDIDWSNVRDNGGMFLKSKNEAGTYFRTLPEPLYSWFYDSSGRSPKFVISETTSEKYVHIHYRLRAGNDIGYSDWRYIKPVSIYHKD